jgi:8-oxo-dGTP pyrophosphatase MutT (NUDIX family)
MPTGAQASVAPAYDGSAVRPPKVRRTVRVVLVDEQQRVLLGLVRDPSTGHTIWTAPGGGIEAGESPVTAAHREVAEETGLTGIDLGPEIWRQRQLTTWRDIRWDQHETWFLADVPHFDPDISRLSETERKEMIRWQWWPLDQLSRTKECCAPHDLTARLSPRLARAG